MALTTDIVTVPMKGGLDTKSDPKQIPPTKLINLVNGQFNTPGEIGKRYGFTHENFPSTTLNNNIYSYNNQTLADVTILGQNTLMSYSSASSSWNSQGDFTQLQATQSNIYASGFGQTGPDAAQINQTICVVFMDYNTNLPTLVIKEVDTNTILNTTVIDSNSTATAPKVVALGANFVITYIKTVSPHTNIYYVIVSPGTPWAVSSPTKIGGSSTTLQTGLTAYDTVVNANGAAYIVWGTNTGIVGTFLDNTYTLHTVQNIPIPSGSAAHSRPMITVWVDTSLNVYVAAYDSVSTNLFISKGNQALTSWGTSGDVVTTFTSPQYLTGATYSNGTTLIALSESDNTYPGNGSYNRTHIINWASSPHEYFDIPDVAPVSKIWFDSNGMGYFLGVYVSSTQPTFFVKQFNPNNNTSDTALRISPSTISAGEPSNFPFVSSVTSQYFIPGSSILYAGGSCNIPIIKLGQLRSTAGTLSTNTNVGLLTISQSKTSNATTLASLENFDGGLPRTFDGVSLTELGFNLYPDYLTSGNQLAQTALEVPVLTGQIATSAGTLQIGSTFTYNITAVNGFGETTGGTPVYVTPTSSNCAVLLTWSPIQGATGYNIYGRYTPDGQIYLLHYVDGACSTFWIDAGIAVASLSIAMPTSDTTGGVYTLPLGVPSLSVPQQSTNTAQLELSLTDITVPHWNTQHCVVVPVYPGGFPGNTTVWYRVQAVFPSSNGGYNFGFNFGEEGTGTPQNALQLYFNSPYTATIEWTAVPGATAYIIWGRGVDTNTSDTPAHKLVTLFTSDLMSDPVTSPMRGGVQDFAWNDNNTSVPFLDTHPPSGLTAGTYYYGVSTQTAVGESSITQTQSITVSQYDRVALAFNTVTGADASIINWRIWRGDNYASVSSNDLLLLNDSGPSNSTWIDDGTYTPEISPYGVPPVTTTTYGGTLPILHAYYYKVAATYQQDSETLPSNEVIFALTSPGGIVLNWTPVQGASGYHIYRGDLAGTDYSLYDTSPDTSTTWIDQGTQTLDKTSTPLRKDTTANSLSGTAYTYVATYEWLDSFGITHYSAPSPELNIFTIHPISGNYSIEVSIPTLKTTNKSNVNIVLYRTVGNAEATQTGLVFYYVGQVINDPTQVTLNIVDQIDDIAILGNIQCYTNGGVLENIYPGSCTGLTQHDDCAFMIDTCNPLNIWYSKPRIENTPLEFNDSLQIIMDELGGQVTGMASIDAKIVVFKENRIYISDSQGLNQVGAGDNFTSMIPLPGDVGCIDPGSIISSSQGIYFRSQRGIYFLDRSNILQYIGYDIENILVDQTISSAIIVPDKHQVRFSLQNSQIVLIYDWLVQQWSKWVLPHANITTALLNGTYSTLGTNGSVYQENVGIYSDDGSWVPLTIKTAWINPGALQKWMRTKHIGIIGTKSIGNFNIELNIRSRFDDGDSTNLQTQNFNTATIPIESGILEVMLHVRDQRANSVQLEIIDSSIGDATIDQGLTISAASFEIGLKRGVSKLPQIKLG